VVPWDGVVYIYPARMAPRSGYDCNYKVRCVKTLQSGILGIIQRENTASAKERPVVCITRQDGREYERKGGDTQSQDEYRLSRCR
jgi:hypothetical protein